MTIPDGFLFSQGNLQDYVDCQRRFQLRHILRQAWPAVEAEPFLEFEHKMELGARFHVVIRQHLSGISESQIESTLGDEMVINDWWMNYKLSFRQGLLKEIMERGKYFEEISLSTPINKFRLVAKYDLLVLQPDGKLIIMDWKTSQTHPKRKWLANRLQSHVYPYVLATGASTLINRLQPDPAEIEMIYWFTNQPDQPERFSYDIHLFKDDARYLENLIMAIDQKTEAVFPLTPDVQRCLFCTYRSLCNRGIKPGEWRQLEDWQEDEISADNFSINYDQIGEIEF
jgi:CRISPR/Cas system-associated exonuclease Cas4 (RecB family)